MKKSNLLSLVATILFLAVLSSFAHMTSAQEIKELPVKERKALLNEAAIKYGIPPEILKAIALAENSMSQFEGDGVTPRVSKDGGIGILQVTLTEEEMRRKNINIELLKNDTAYNIDVGAQILLEKWNNPNLPRINDKDRNKIEHWYFAVMAYNGLSKINDPGINGKNAYQEKVFQIIRDFALLPLAEIPTIQLNYQAGSNIIYFPPGIHYNWSNANTPSPTLTLNKGQRAIIYNKEGQEVNIRTNPNGTIIDSIPNGMAFQIKDIEETDYIYNLYNFYKVENNDYKGYVASSYLREYSLMIMNKILPSNHREPIGRLHIRRDGTELLKLENGRYVKDRDLVKDGFLRLYGVKDGYYDVGNRYVRNDDNRALPLIGRVLISGNNVYLYKRLDNGKEEKVRLVEKGAGLRVYSVSGKDYNVGNGYFVKKEANTKFYTGFVAIKKDTYLYTVDGKPYTKYKAGQQFRVYDIDGNKIQAGGGFYFINDQNVEYKVH
ncbi:SH3 domain-containing protein [Lederbergia citri]|uniref:SH3 domain-containing protein n=1 Tax=Lederbergia citri TaxID=2833580 RepID=A0A942TFX6_9BACI|nr:SH3 domain-containing protein [Lederbergia citri]MBS4195807.1 SH3 domain-containing protein [Lederbergia citri]